ncbi:hypothetical protein [Tahibacter harae]|uniref:Uncharacterized protein n=1 Tax=Tahibacter harae TaxID=2963937 RepID=A0ABT1QS51_9GAMM|nr:hypothetical protein [Tahibacter harae]MCQ4165113.1 hypothetical protein [Tahibacter harae]
MEGIQTNRELFQQELARQYTALFAVDPDYIAARKRHTPEGLAQLMTAGLERGSADKSGRGVRNTCSVLGIKHTYKAISAYMAGDCQAARA